jgi:hypothetical protein
MLFMYHGKLWGIGDESIALPPLPRTITMKLCEKYRIKALACEKLGREVPNRDFKSAWEEIAIEWHALANRRAEEAGGDLELRIRSK